MAVGMPIVVALLTILPIGQHRRKNCCQPPTPLGFYALQVFDFDLFIFFFEGTGRSVDARAAFFILCLSWAATPA